MPAFRKLRDKVRRHWKYLRDQRGNGIGSLSSIATQENPGDKRNTHWMVAVPEPWLPEFERSVRKFLCKVANTDDLGAAVLFERLYAVGGAMKYALKGIDPAYQDYFKIDFEDQGFVSGRGRIFVSRDIGPAARKKRGWVRARLRRR